MSTPDDDLLLTAVNIKLTGIAEASRSPPSWYGDWKRLGPESTEEERLAVYRAIRDSGCLPGESGFCLVSGQVEVMANLEAETSLRDLNDRMEAVEKAHKTEKGKPWPNDQVPEEYKELWRQYQDAWDEIFVRKLKAFGEQEMADLYSAAPEHFNRCYEIGLQYFKRLVKADKAISPDELVTVTSCLDVPRADLVRLALAREGIPAALGNANFLSWCWHYSNAVGGVTIHVRHRDAENAREVLTAARARPSVSLPPWICSSCGQQVAGQWDVCWQCGHLADGTPGDPLAEEVVAQPNGDSEAGKWQASPRLFAVALCVGLAVVLLKCGLKPLVLLAPFVCFFVFLLQRLGPRPGQQPEPQGVTESGDLPAPGASAARSRVSRALVQRAWQAAVIAVLTFPPLGFYSMRLLCKLVRRGTPLSRADRWRFWMALLLSILTILICLAFVGMLLFALRGAIT